MGFKISTGGVPAPDTPEALLADLRSRKIPGLLAHQADVLRAYVEEAQAEPDVALQLPTGSGKTLVGLLIGEWNRRKDGERTVYLCATNQLVNQVARQATESYGMKVLAFTGPKSAYSPSNKAAYNNSEAIAITSYAALFNTNPFFADPNLIILDDAHSAENYVADFWSLRIDRYDTDHSAAYNGLVNILHQVMSRSDIAHMLRPPLTLWDNNWVDKIPTPDFYTLIPEITACLDQAAPKSDIRFTWSVLRDHLVACHLYVGTHAILIRPLIPPADTHSPFAGARQRIYMSATLSKAGDLERMVGRRQIKRLPVPPGWDKQGIGRRFFLLPDQSLDADSTRSAVLKSIEQAGRAVILVPDSRSATELRKDYETDLKFPFFDAQQLEESKGPFVSSAKAVAIVANRYDGIDLVDDDCRLLIMQGVPSATNLQEKFIVERMGALLLLQDRVRTRVVQGFGRCTRSPTDFACVMLLGEQLCNYLLKRDSRKLFHPEIQAELEFGIEQSKGIDEKTILTNLALFLAQGEEWQKADANIVKRRQNLEQADVPAAEQLKAAVEAEVEYAYALWAGDYVRALEYCRSVLAKLKEPALRGYRALWHYLAGSSAWLAEAEGQRSLASVGREQYAEAMKRGRGVRWLATLSQYVESTSDEGPDPRTESIVERLGARIEELGILHDGRYDKEEQQIIEGIQSDNPELFEEAHKRLGLLLGYDADNSKGSGAPDPWWIVDESLCLVFEDHSDGKASGTIGANKARQAAGHPEWIKANTHVDDKADIQPILVTPATKADRDALPHLANVRLWPLNEFRAWVIAALATVRELRNVFRGRDDLEWRADAMDKLEQNHIAPTAILESVTSKASEVLRVD